MSKRDELAHEYINSIFRLEPWQEPPDFDECFKHGYDAAMAEADERVKGLIEALSKPFICINCNERESEEWGKACKIKEDACCSFRLDLSEALAKFAAYKKD